MPIVLMSKMARNQYFCLKPADFQRAMPFHAIIHAKRITDTHGLASNHKRVSLRDGIVKYQLMIVGLFNNQKLNESKNHRMKEG